MSNPIPVYMNLCTPLNISFQWYVCAPVHFANGRNYEQSARNSIALHNESSSSGEGDYSKNGAALLLSSCEALIRDSSTLKATLQMELLRALQKRNEGLGHGFYDPE